jgi:hypothetical protein
MQYSDYAGVDTIRADLLPHDGQSAFDFYPKAIQTDFGLHTIFIFATMALALTLAFRGVSAALTAFPAFGQELLVIGFVIGILSFAVALMTCDSESITKSLHVIGFSALAVVGLVSAAIGFYLYAFVMHSLALLSLVVLADVVLDHTVNILVAHPKTRMAAKDRIRAFWGNRWNEDAYTTPILAIVFVHIIAFTCHHTVVAFAGSAPWVAFAMAMTFVLCSLFLTCCLGIHPHAKPETLFWRALVHCVAYSPHPYAAGVVRRTHPVSLATTATTPLVVSLVLFSAALLPAARYLPMTASLWNRAFFVQQEEDPHAPKPERAPDIELFDNLSMSAQLARYDRLRRDRERMEGYYRGRSHGASGIERFLQMTEPNDVDARAAMSPEAWIPLALFNGFRNAPAFTVATFVSSFLASVVVATVLFLAQCYLLVVPTLWRLTTMAGEREEEEPFDELTEWDEKVSRLHDSPFYTDQESIYKGINLGTGEPVLVPRVCFHRHMQYLGDNQSGKTAAMTSDMTQLMRMQARDRDSSNPRQQSSIVVLDFKGEPYQFHNARLEAEALGLPFKFFNLSTGLPTFAFNPFLQKNYRALASYERANQLLASLALAHGLSYGRSWFTRASESVLIPFLKEFGNRISSFRDLHEYLNGSKQDLLRARIKLTAQDREHAGELIAAVKKLTFIEALNVTADQPGCEHVVENQIDFFDAFNTPQVVYFFLPTARNHSLVTEVGRLVVFLLLDAATHVEQEQLRTGGMKTPHQIYLFIDEFQQLVSEFLAIFFEQAASKRIGVLVAHQTVSQLKTPTADLTGTISGNTHVRQVFAATDLAQQSYLIEESGDGVDQISDTEPEDSILLAEDRPLPRIRKNDVIAMTAQPLASVLRVSHPEGYAQYEGFSQRIVGEFHISKEEFERRKMLPWPKQEDYPGTFTPKSDIDEGEGTAGVPVEVGPAPNDSGISASLTQALKEQEARRDQQHRAKPKKRRTSK